MTLQSVCNVRRQFTQRKETEDEKAKVSLTFPAHLVLSMIFSANSFPVDLGRKGGIRARNEKSNDPVTQLESAKESRTCSRHAAGSWKVSCTSRVYRPSSDMGSARLLN